MSDFVTEKQFIRARKILRKLLYKNTMDDYDKDLGLLNYDNKSHGNYTIGVEGHKMLNILIERYSINSEELEKIENLEEIQEQDRISLSDRGLGITLYPEDE